MRAGGVDRPAPPPSSGSRAPARLAIACLAFIGLARLLLVVDVLRQPEPSAHAFDEDAFYVLAVARNLAAGHGPSADGESLTNGVQPLWTLLAAVPYRLAGSERGAFAALYAGSAALWLLGAWLFARLVLGFLPETGRTRLAALFAMTLFLGDGRVQTYFFNGLETGLYAVTLLALVLAWRALVAGGADGQEAGSTRFWRGRSGTALVGLLLAAAIWARNDAVLIGLALAVVAAASSPGGRLARRLVPALALAAVLIAPWLAFNLWLDGSAVPQSGRATNLGPNHRPLDAVKLRDTAAVLGGIAYPPFLPGASRIPPLAAGAAGAAILAALALALRRSYPGPTARAVAVSTAPLFLGSLALLLYYVARSGAVWMYPRYLMPLALAVLVVWALVLLALAREPRAAALLPAVMLLLVALNASRMVLWFGRQAPHMGPGVLELIARGHCDGAERIGMFESGRSGYRCPAVRNLDGKVNLDALHALEEHRLFEYVRQAGFRRLVFRRYTEHWLDADYPEWRAACEMVPSDPAAELVECIVLAPRATPRP